MVNSRLKDAITKAKQNNMPNDNIERCIKKAAGEGAGDNYEEITYEGYGPSGVAVIVEALTDNRNRTAGDMRHYFDKCGGNLGNSGCVTFMFDQKGVIIMENAKDEEQAMMDALEAGAEDYSVEEEYTEILTASNDLGAVRDALEEKGYTVISSEVQMLPQNTATLTDETDLKNMTKLIEMLEETG